MSRDLIITQLYNSSEVKKSARYLAPKNWRELLQIGFTALCELPEESLIAMNDNGRVKNYLFQTMYYQVRNNRSAFNAIIYNESLFVECDAIDSELQDVESEEYYLSIPTFSDFISYCAKIIETTSDPIKLAAEVTYQYYTYTPIRKRSYGDFSSVTGINKATISQYINLIKTKFKDEANRISP